MNKVFLAVIAVLMVGVAAGAAYVDAININFGAGIEGGSVSGTFVTPQAPGLGNNWVNVIGYGKYTYSPTITTTSGGRSVSFQVLIYDADVYQGPGGGGGGQVTLAGASGTPGHAGIQESAQMRFDIMTNGLPAAWVTAGYEIWALMGTPAGHSQEIPAYTWYQVSAANSDVTADLTNGVGAQFYFKPRANGMSYHKQLAAVQILVIGGAGTLLIVR